MFKLFYDLEHAPRAWGHKSHDVFIQRLWRRQLTAEPELYCVHGIALSDACGLGAPQRVQERVEEKHEQTTSRTSIILMYDNHNLVPICWLHVGDVKRAAGHGVADVLFKHLDVAVGPCKAEWRSFMQIASVTSTH